MLVAVTQLYLKYTGDCFRTRKHYHSYLPSRAQQRCDTTGSLHGSVLHKYTGNQDLVPISLCTPLSDLQISRGTHSLRARSHPHHHPVLQLHTHTHVGTSVGTCLSSILLINRV